MVDFENKCALLTWNFDGLDGFVAVDLMVCWSAFVPLGARQKYLEPSELDCAVYHDKT